MNTINSNAQREEVKLDFCFVSFNAFWVKKACLYYSSKFTFFFIFFILMLWNANANSNANPNSNEMTKYWRMSLENYILGPFHYLISKPSFSDETPRVENPIQTVSPKVTVSRFHIFTLYAFVFVDDVALFSTVSLFSEPYSLHCFSNFTVCLINLRDT